MSEKILILLSTHNGEAYIECLLDSLRAQIDCEFDILVRDDGSTDLTTHILGRYQSEDKLKWYKGQNIGAANSFMNLIYDAPSYDYYALCDQDDYWEPDKLVRALRKMRNYPSDIPVLYYGCPTVTDKDLNNIDGYNSLDLFVNTFEGSLITSNSYGCTMVFNHALIQILKKKKVYDVYMHDVWIHKVCLIFGGILIYDRNVHMKYRQHGNNSVGASIKGTKAILKHANSLFNKDCIRSAIVKRLYENYCENMSGDIQSLCRQVIGYRSNLSDKIAILLNRKIKTDSVKRNILFRLAVLSNAY